MRNFALVLLALSLLSACTKKKDENPNILRLVEPAKIKTMDPAGAQELYSQRQMVMVYETLYQYAPFKRPYELEPLLAEGMPTVSKDGLTYTIKVKKGVFFHDDPAFPGGKGREMKAKDFIYSIMRLGDPRANATGWWLFENRVKGLDEWKAKQKESTNFDEEIAGLKALDDYTLQISLKQKFPQLTSVLAMLYTSAVAREVVEKYGKEIINHAVGTGPFMMVSFNPSQEIVYVRNPKYRDEFMPKEGLLEGSDKVAPLADAGHKLPFVDGVVTRIITEDQPRWLHLMNRDLDYAFAPKDNFGAAVEAKDPSKPLSVDNLKLKPEMVQRQMQLAAEFEAGVTYVAMNVDSSAFPQLKDKRVRQAISLAIDRNELIKLFYHGIGLAAQTVIPPDIKGYDSKYVNAYARFDVEKAKKLLAEAGYPEGKGFPELPFDAVADSTNRQIAEFYAKSFAAIGLKLKIDSYTWPQLVQRTQNRQSILWGQAWGADYPDGENFLQLFYGPNAHPGGENATYYKNKDFDRQLEEARVMQDTPERANRYRKLAEFIADEAPIALGVFRVWVPVRQPWIKYGRYDEFPFNRAKYVKIDLEQKKQFQK